MEYDGLSSVRSRLFSILVTTSWYSSVYTFFDCSSCGQFSSRRQITNEPPIIIDIVVTASEEFRVSICQVLSITQECECRAVLKSEIALGDCWYLVPVGIFTGDLLEIDLALPTVVMAECGHYLQALVHYESPVAFNGPGVLKLVYKVREHEDHKVPQCSLIGYL